MTIEIVSLEMRWSRTAARNRADCRFGAVTPQGSRNPLIICPFQPRCGEAVMVLARAMAAFTVAH